MTRWIAAIAVVAVVLAGVGGAVLAFTGGSGDPAGDQASPSPTSPAPTSSPSGPAATTGPLARFYNQALQWEPCGNDDCAELEVPIDYQHPDAGSLRIALERAPATDKRIGSLVINPGGPGVPGTDTAKDADLYFSQRLRGAYDIVGFDARGTGTSDPIDCLSDDELDAEMAADPEPDTPAEIADDAAQSQRFWAGCAAAGRLSAHMSSIEVARDMDVLRSALDEKKLDYIGFSYGTRLGATYAELFPQQVGKFVLDGATDPALSARASALSQAKGFETALRAYVQDCIDGGRCYLGETMDGALGTITDLIARIDKDPLPTDDPDGRELTVGLAFYGLITPLYRKEDWVLLDEGLHEALDKGTGSTLLLLADWYSSREQGGGYSDNSLEAISVVNCLDDPSAISPAEVPGQYQAFEKASPTFGRVFAWGLTACEGLPARSTEPRLAIDGAGAAPIVVLGTTRDPATPYAEAVALADELESGVLVSRDGDGHTAYHSGNACIDDAVHAYLLDDVVPRDGLRC